MTHRLSIIKAVNDKKGYREVLMKKADVMDTANVYYYGIDLSKFKLDLPKESKKHKAPAKRYICSDLEMTEFTSSQRTCVPGAKYNEQTVNEVTQKVTVKFTANQKKILEEIKKNPFVTQEELVEIVGITRKSIIENMKKLQNQKIIKRVGADKNGHFEII